MPLKSEIKRLKKPFAFLQIFRFFQKVLIVDICVKDKFEYIRKEISSKIFEKLFDIAGVKAMAINKACAC